MDVYLFCLNYPKIMRNINLPNISLLYPTLTDRTSISKVSQPAEQNRIKSYKYTFKQPHAIIYFKTYRTEWKENAKENFAVESTRANVNISTTKRRRSKRRTQIYDKFLGIVVFALFSTLFRWQKSSRLFCSIKFYWISFGFMFSRYVALL